jgi:hypothetical protein
MGADNRNIPEELNNPKREERPRSLVDLIELKTIDLDLAAWLVSHVSKGNSLITGSGPGGIGKSTTMRALMAFAPGNLPFAIAWPEKITGIESPSCVISHEISDHRPPGYLWGQDARDFFAHSERGSMLVGNMHADDLDEVHHQIVEACEVPEAQFRSVNFFIFLWIEGVDRSVKERIKDNPSRRFITKIFYSDGENAHALVYSDEIGLPDDVPRDADYEQQCRGFLKDAVENSTRDINELRHRFLDWAQENA